ncbi:hypothetical protein A3I46_00835 [Candidatus Kaiserbacteria bacterium RIFCSPLOWO2_02_FULL_54_13]|nr:MAG: hypothetical protein UY91_C0020G0012 [Parcubacteria group bacterium GW2011_GWB1_55_9]OGG82434.1 MAG: hypothetical protein A3I46_00835 [Candidatus Kaiserbacteria bacterium RIFCSPLOWO2_02_FULL_54_13]
MGTPRELNKFSVREMHDALLLAKETAMNFRSLNARIKALDHLRISLLPMVEWLDKPISECFPGPWDTPLRASVKRALPLFQQFGRTFPPVALTRKGDWVTLTSDGVIGVASDWLALAISRSRCDILEAFPWGHKRENVIATESAGMREVVEHCAFLKYLALGMKRFDEILKERERRLHVMRSNSSFLGSFIGGIDPFEYSASESSFPGYSVFNRHSRGTNRGSGIYFVPGPVEKEVKERNKRWSPGSGYESYVFRDSRRLNKLEDFLSCVGRSIEEVSDGGQFARKPLSDEEKKVITDFAKKIGDSPK